MYRLKIEKDTPEYTRHIQRAPKGRPRKSTQKTLKKLKETQPTLQNQTKTLNLLLYIS